MRYRALLSKVKGQMRNKEVAPHNPDYENDATEKFLTVASFFGAQRNNETLSQATDVNRFYDNLRSHHSYLLEEEISINQLQENITTVNWIEFVTRMAGFKDAVSTDSIILIDSVDKTQRWLDLISRTNNRPLANFIMWKAAEDAMEHLITNVHNSVSKHSSIKRREFCYEQLKKSFIINPIEIIWMRRYLSPEKRQKINSMVLSVRDRLVKDLEKIDWANSDDQKQMVSKIKEMQIIIGMPGNYFNDDLLNAMDIDLVYNESGDFMELVGQTKRNKETIQYRRIKGSKEDNLILKMFEWRELYFGIGSFLSEDNVFFASGIFTREDLFNENRPSYINYAVGVFLFQTMVLYIDDQSSWTDQTKKNFEEKIRCVDRSLKKLDLTTFEVKLILKLSDIQRIAYEAYRDFTRTNGEEQKLIGLDYTPNQLFWIFNMLPYCQPVNNYSGKFMEIFRNGSVFAKTSSGARSLIPQFLQDFSCSETSRMHSKETCRMF
ncbi:hypothetical protein FQA39_LY19046 [Lamprigera yunnana]|nr:hypothetical protein FQA39_LY19046 [Lamprigera yunnana]